MKILMFVILLVFAIGLLNSPMFSQTYTGNIVRWLDADTVEFRASSGKYYRTRLLGIDAPELRQTQGKECRTQFEQETRLKRVSMTIAGRDNYRRILGKLSTDEIPDLSLWLIEAGCAWEYSAPLSVKTIYQTAEQTARENETGLWFESNPTPPWAFRSDGYLRTGNCPE